MDRDFPVVPHRGSLSVTRRAGMVRPGTHIPTSFLASLLPGAICFMRRILLLASTLLLQGCAGSGFYSYLGDTFTPPFGANPNGAPGTGENYAKIRGKPDATVTPAPVLYEAGDVWPAPPKAPPTLKDLQAQQAADMKNGGQGYAPLQPLPTLPGYEVPQQQPQPYVPSSSFSQGTVHRPNGAPLAIGGDTALKGQSGNGNIIVPNGNGTSTVISPTGTVTTIPTPGK
jgi:hypothetical protein